MNGETISVTPSHPFYVNKFGWTLAGSLRAGDVLVLSNGEYVIVEWVQHEILEAPVKVYNFEVEDFHTYFVGENSVLVHNWCILSEDDTIAAIKSARRKVQKEMKNITRAQNLLKQGKYNQYGTLFHSEVSKKVKAMGIDGLNVNTQIIRPGSNGGKGNIRIPDYSFNSGGMNIILDLKPNGYSGWRLTSQYNDFYNWLSIQSSNDIIQLNYYR